MTIETKGPAECVDRYNSEQHQHPHPQQHPTLMEPTVFGEETILVVVL